MSGQPVKAFDTAYPGSMCEREDGYYVERNDHKSMAAALVELIASRDREIEDLREAVIQLKRFVEAAPYLLDACESLLTDVGTASSIPGAVKARAAIARATGATT